MISIMQVSELDEESTYVSLSLVCCLSSAFWRILQLRLIINRIRKRLVRGSLQDSEFCAHSILARRAVETYNLVVYLGHYYVVSNRVLRKREVLSPINCVMGEKDEEIIVPRVSTEHPWRLFKAPIA